MKRFLLLATVLLAACSGPTGAARLDPSVLVVNLSDVPGRVIYVPDVGVTDTNLVPAHATVCTRWTQPFDSLYLRVEYGVQGDSLGRFGNVVSPWVHLSEYPNYFQIDTIPALAGHVGGGSITGHIAAQEC